MGKQISVGRTVALAALACTVIGSGSLFAQRYPDQQYPDQRSRDQRYNDQRRDPWEWDGNYQRLAQLNEGTFIPVRITSTIDVEHAQQSRAYPAVVAEDVWDDYNRLSVPAIPAGSRADVVVRTERDGDLVLDLDAISAHGQRYVVTTAPERIEANQRPRDNSDTAAYLGGGALLGTIIGAIAGGGKGAAIGAATGAAGGYGVMAYRGRSIHVPAGSVLTFRLEQPLTIGRDVRGTSGQYPPPPPRR